MLHCIEVRLPRTPNTRLFADGSVTGPRNGLAVRSFCTMAPKRSIFATNTVIQQYGIRRKRRRQKSAVERRHGDTPPGRCTVHGAPNYPTWPICGVFSQLPLGMAHEVRNGRPLWHDEPRRVIRCRSLAVQLRAPRFFYFSPFTPLASKPSQYQARFKDDERHRLSHN
jgi:hypothetical protein